MKNKKVSIIVGICIGVLLLVVIIINHDIEKKDFDAMKYARSNTFFGEVYFGMTFEEFEMIDLNVQRDVNVEDGMAFVDRNSGNYYIFGDYGEFENRLEYIISFDPKHTVFGIGIGDNLDNVDIIMTKNDLVYVENDDRYMIDFVDKLVTFEFFSDDNRKVSGFEVIVHIYD